MLRGLRGGLAGWLVMAIAPPAGCVGHAQVELAAADAMESVAAETTRALDEYDHETRAADAERQRRVLAAFVERTKQDHANEEAMSGHETMAAAALEAIDADREAARLRRTRAGENVAVLRETAAGLRRFGVESMRLDDEMRRYVESLIEARKRAIASAPPTTAPAGANDGTKGGR